METYDWAECTRTVLGRILPEAVVVLPIGATEQHGPHLPTGTDTLIVGAVAREAVRRAARDSARALVLAPTIPVGASDHHFPFGATLSLEAETVTRVLLDLLRSVRNDGGSRVLIVNGHGGNRGPCHTAAQAASVRYGMHVGYLDYWTLLAVDAAADGDGTRIPGHAGAFETSMVAHMGPGTIAELPEHEHEPVPREPRPDIDDVVMHSETTWRAVDGYTDQPANARAEDGERWFRACVEALSARIVNLAAGF